MNTTKLLEFYINMGFKLLPVKKNKEPLVPGFTDPSYKGLSIKDAEKRIKNDEWIAGLMPKDIIAIDIDTEENKKLAIDIFEIHQNTLTQQTKNGYHLLFKTNENITGGSKTLCALGTYVTYRLPEKNYIILEPSTNKKWLDLQQEIRPLPSFFKPLNDTQNINIATAIIGRLILSKLNNELDGYIFDIFTASTAFNYNIKSEQIHYIMEKVWKNKYNKKITENIIQREKTLNKKIGFGSVIFFLQELQNQTTENILKYVKKKPVVQHQENSEIEIIESSISEYIKYKDIHYIIFKNSNIAINLNSNDFEQIISKKIYELNNKIISKNLIEDIIILFKSKCEYNHQRIYNRVGSYNNNIYININNINFIKINKTKYEIIKESPIRFTKSNILPLPEQNTSTTNYLKQLFQKFNKYGEIKNFIIDFFSGKKPSLILEQDNSLIIGKTINKIINNSTHINTIYDKTDIPKNCDIFIAYINKENPILPTLKNSIQINKNKSMILITNDKINIKEKEIENHAYILDEIFKEIINNQ